MEEHRPDEIFLLLRIEPIITFGLLVALLLPAVQRLVPLRDAMVAMLAGFRAMLLALLVLTLAWALSAVCGELQTAEYMVGLAHATVTPHWLPALTFVLAAAIAFATGSSWGTMAILEPLVIPICHNLSLAVGHDPSTSSYHVFLYASIASVLAGSVWGDPRAVNLAANSMGRFNTLTGFMSQWSSRSQADGPSNLAKTSVPVLHLTYCADQSVFPSTVRRWLAAAPDRTRNVDIHGGDHYLIGRPDLVSRVAPGGVHVDTSTGAEVHQPGCHLAPSGVADADEQHLGHVACHRVPRLAATGLQRRLDDRQTLLAGSRVFTAFTIA